MADIPQAGDVLERVTKRYIDDATARLAHEIGTFDGTATVQVNLRDSLHTLLPVIRDAVLFVVGEMYKEAGWDVTIVESVVFLIPSTK
jgi:hypothetical protein